ncbi:MAG: bi-domain-containing oxidoreductase [bacterium]|nr:MAG: bi-domain-containing oxidoreductase [bacterium]
MRQILQNLKTGHLEVVEVPTPAVKAGHLLIQTLCSLISSGTERMLVSFAKSSLISKARQQPDKVKQVIDKIKTDGLLPTIHSVYARLDEPLPLGYCNCGTVIEVGNSVEEFSVGDRVVSNGPHAEIVCVPKNLCAKVPESVTDEQSVFTVLASIGLQGIRLIRPTFGEIIVIYGLGLIGLICVQLLKGCGCKVIGIDIDNNKLELARKYGAKVIDVTAGAEPIETAIAYSHNRGVDGVLITASAKNDKIVHQAAQMCRKRGRIVLVGVVDLKLNRADFYDKEIKFQVSCSYGPGRYDNSYEEEGHDYPYGFVRWTEQRNFQAILDSFAAGSLNVSDLVSECIPQTDAQKAYQMLIEDSSKLALILTYPTGIPKRDSIINTPIDFVKTPSIPEVIVGLIGAGNFARMTLLPVLKHLKVRCKTVADINGVSCSYAARKFGFENAINDYHKLLDDPDINTVFITTRHDLHARMVIEALEAGKHVAVEKPLCLNTEELVNIKEAYLKACNQQFLVGFNRRFSPHAQKIHSLIASRSQPMCMTILVNAGMIPADTWIQNKCIGGGRIIGEGCHWIDLMRYWVAQPIVSVCATMVGTAGEVEIRDDKMTILLVFADGSIGTLHYFANGHKSYPKETIELFCDGKILHLNNFRKLRGYGWRNFNNLNLLKQDKGNRTELQRFLELVRSGGDPLITFEEIENVTLASFAAVKSADGAGKIDI